MNKFEVIKLLNQGIYSYKELSEITGYHEKSLIRLNSQILKGLISPIHGNKNRKPHNYISNDIKIKLVNEFKKGDFKSYQSFYLYLKENNKNFSYSFIRKLLFQNNVKKQNIKSIAIVKRKLIANNIIQHKNVRYKIIDGNIEHHVEVELHFYNNLKRFVIYNNKKYYLKEIKRVNFRTGLSKYY